MKTLIACFVFLVLYVEPCVQVDFCPPTEWISPCQCAVPFPGFPVIVLCEGPSITQAALDNLFTVLRGETSKIIISRFDLYNSELTTLDLTHMADTQLLAFALYNNSHLTKINGTTRGSISASSLQIQLCEMTNEKFGDMLSYFHPPAMTSLEVPFNNFKGAPLGQEFFPGLSKFRNLRILDLGSNKVTELGGGQFKSNTALEMIYFPRNPIQYIGEDAFLFDPPKPLGLDITLTYGNLTSDMIHPNSGFGKIPGGSRMSLSMNNLATIPADVFGDYLKAPENRIEIGNNQIFCDIRVKWLKDGKDRYERYLTGAKCVNDPGNTVFNSTLIP
jgi:hypothetical protein